MMINKNLYLLKNNKLQKMSYPIFKEFYNLSNQEEINELYKLIDFNEDKLIKAEIHVNNTKTNELDESIRKCKEYQIDKSYFIMT